MKVAFVGGLRGCRQARILGVFGGLAVAGRLRAAGVAYGPGGLFGLEAARLEIERPSGADASGVRLRDFVGRCKIDAN